jgi:hypothetical protein
MRYRGLDLPEYETSAVIMSHNGTLADVAAHTDAETMVRHVNLDTHYAPKKGLPGVLKMVDTHLDYIGEIAPRALSVVSYTWGFAPRPKSYRPQRIHKNSELIPDEFILVSEVSIVKPAVTLSMNGNEKIEDIFTKYFETRKQGKPYLYDLHPGQCVRKKKSKPAILVDIEPRIYIF